VVGEKYLLVRPLGEGGMGLVFEAAHLRLRRNVAIKFLRPDALTMPDALARFEREARATAGMRSPHVVHVLDVDSDQFGRPYIVMELLRGHDLETELRSRGPLPIAQAVDFVLQACAAVRDAHEAGVVHRDLKPSNLFLSYENGAQVIKVLDFGISKIACESEPWVTSTAVTVGTPLYMSPEQVRSSRDVDARADIWSLGVILYELIAGSPPFQGTTTAAVAAIVADAVPSLRDQRPETPEALERVVMTALAKSPDDRFPTAEALGAALIPFSSGEEQLGPRSLRPSAHAFRIASYAIARAPVTPHAGTATELLRLPTSRGDSPPAGQRPASTAWTFAGALVLGMGAATVMSLFNPPIASIQPRAEHAQVVPAPARPRLELASGRADAGRCDGAGEASCVEPSTVELGTMTVVASHAHAIAAQRSAKSAGPATWTAAPGAAPRRRTTSPEATHAPREAPLYL
jgi:serine/threonine-protein kinase